MTGTGTGRLLLLGHLDTVVDHARHRPVSLDAHRMTGSGTVDMKGGDVLALGVLRALAQDRTADLAEVALLLVCDEEWRTEPFAHVRRFGGFDACLCFEAGERTADGGEAVVVRRKAAGSILVDAHGRSAHSGASPDDGRNALLALARVAQLIAAAHDPHGPDRLTSVPTILQVGEALNVVPAAGRLTADLRADRLEAIEAVLATLPAEIDEVRLEARMGRRWPGMDARESTAALLAAAARAWRPIAEPSGRRLGREPLRGGNPLTVDGLGPSAGAPTRPTSTSNGVRWSRGRLSRWRSPMRCCAPHERCTACCSAPSEPLNRAPPAGITPFGWSGGVAQPPSSLPFRLSVRSHDAEFPSHG